MLIYYYHKRKHTYTVGPRRFQSVWLLTHGYTFFGGRHLIICLSRFRSTAPLPSRVALRLFALDRPATPFTDCCSTPLDSSSRCESAEALESILISAIRITEGKQGRGKHSKGLPEA